MKRQYILQVMGMNSSKFGGLEQFITELARELSVYNIQLILMYNNKYPDSKKYLELLSQSDVKIIITNSLNPIKFFFDFCIALYKYKPIVIHSHFQPVYSLFYAKILGFKNRYVTLHSMITDKNLKEVYDINNLNLRSKMIRWIINFSSDKIIPVSKAVQLQYLSLFPNTKLKLELVYLGALPHSNKKAILDKDINLDKKYINIGCVIFGSKIKGADILIEASKILKDEHSLKNFRICLIGLSEYHHYTHELKELTKKYNLEEYIIWLGIRNNVSDLLSSMDIYCQPSRTEAISLAIMEASMAGLPCIGSEIGGIPEVIIHNQTGYLFQVENSIELAKFLKSLILNETLRKEMGSKAREYILNNFNMTLQVKKMVDMYLRKISLI